MIGKVIKHFRKRKGMSQKDLANQSGLNRGYISSIEQGYSNPTINALTLICNSLNVPLELAFFMSYKVGENDKKLSHIKGLVTEMYINIEKGLYDDIREEI